MPFAVTHTLGHAMPSIHWPPELQICCVEPLQRVVAGVHWPRHAFGVTVASQIEGHPMVTHAPFASQSCRLLPMHLVWLGSHSPVQPVVLQTCGQTVVVAHAPALQVCSVLPLHCVEPFAHVPQAPWLQIIAVQAAPLLAQRPLLSQICGWLPLHCMVPRVHVPAHTLFEHT